MAKKVTADQLKDLNIALVQLSKNTARAKSKYDSDVTPTIVNNNKEEPNPYIPELSKEEKLRELSKKKVFLKEQRKYPTADELRKAVDSYFDKVDRDNAIRKQELECFDSKVKREYTLYPYLKEELVLHLGITYRELNHYVLSTDTCDVMEYVDNRIFTQIQRGNFTSEMNNKAAADYCMHHKYISNNNNNASKQKAGAGNNSPTQINVVVFHSPEEVKAYCEKHNIENICEPPMNAELSE